MTETIRPASPGDAAAIGRLLVELYSYEAPGIFGGRYEELHDLFAAMAAAESGKRTRNRLVIETEAGAVVGLGAIATAEEPRESLPPWATLRPALALGPRGLARIVVANVRGGLSSAGQPGPDEGFIHSVVLEPGHRGRGLGARMMAALEAESRQRGKTAAALQVVTSNHGAIALYEKLSYRVVRRVPEPGWRARIAFPTVVMRKPLDGG